MEKEVKASCAVEKEVVEVNMEEVEEEVEEEVVEVLEEVVEVRVAPQRSKSR